ncbi:MAG: tRNA pseudouridine(55) synthase TruB [Candidatus Aminicenantes bacterium]|nr:MAG: tRNA pseudouridine(55) synthase TruB [Candidatus Aminicenantes bacterium]
MDGLILVNKSQGITSHDVVVQIRNILGTQKVGHYGTLDPLATGLVVVAVGKTTRLFPFYSKKDKTYTGRMRLGFTTDTFDSTGKPTSTEPKKLPQKAEVLKAMKKFVGEIEQIAPPYSAKKYKGKPLYELVRKNKKFELRPSQISIHFFDLVNYTPPELEFRVGCSSGTYIRSLAHDLGLRLGCGAHLSELNRTTVGNFHMDDSLDLDKIKQLNSQGQIEEFLIPLELLLPEFPKIILNERGSTLAKNGNKISSENIQKIFQDESTPQEDYQEKEAIFRMFTLEGEFLALAKKIPEKDHFHPFLVIASSDDPID